MTRPMTAAQKRVWSKPINPSKNTPALDEQQPKPLKIRFELRDKIEAGVQKRYRMRPIK